MKARDAPRSLCDEAFARKAFLNIHILGVTRWRRRNGPVLEAAVLEAAASQLFSGEQIDCRRLFCDNSATISAADASRCCC